jgi:hypothetical protein
VKYRAVDCGRFWPDSRPCRPDSRYRHPDNGDEVRYAMTVSRSKLLNFGLGCFIRGEGLIPRGSAAVMKVLNPRPTPYENNIPRGSAARLLIFSTLVFAVLFILK